LLDSISTPKAIRKYEKRGILTVKQLSYLFKLKRHRKDAKKVPPVVHQVELQALAIRTGEIYLQEIPKILRQPVELFLDIEGIPDWQEYYLIGLLVCDGNTDTYHSFWADSHKDESYIWQQFLEKLKKYPNAPIYHYGHYERRAIEKLEKSYATNKESLKKRLINVNTFIFGKVYFPVRTNGLKDIGKFLGASWSMPNSSGLQSLVWRYHWEE
jgi:predicted RecB family nuclease